MTVDCAQLGNHFRCRCVLIPSTHVMVSINTSKRPLSKFVVGSVPLCLTEKPMRITHSNMYRFYLGDTALDYIKDLSGRYIEWGKH